MSHVRFSDMTSFLTPQELDALGLLSIGQDVRISRWARIYGAKNITIADGARVDDFSILSGTGGIEIGKFVHIAAGCHLFGAGGIIIEDYAGLSGRVGIYSISDDFSGASMAHPTIPKEFRPGMTLAPVHIGRHVIVGTNSTLLPGVHLGEGCVVGAHSLVKTTQEPWTVCAGVPATRLKNRSRDLLQLEKAFAASLRDQ